jgi:hypothetical protein
MDKRTRPVMPGQVLDMHARLREAFRKPGPHTVRFMDAHVRTSLLNAETDRPDTARSLFAADRDGPALCGEFARDLFTAVTFQVTAGMTDVVHAIYANGRAAIAGLHAEELPAERGFAWLDAPLRLTSRGAADGGGPPIEISAVTWDVCTYALPDGTAVPGVQVTGWADPRRPVPWTSPGGAAPRRVRPALPLIPLLTDVTPLGHAPLDFQRDGTLGFAHWVHVLWIYMSAEITAMHRDPVARAYRRRAAAALRQAEVNVVTLRRARTDGDTSPGEPRDIEWSCCWPVQGHHRHSRLVPGAAPHHATPAASDRGHCAICGGAVTWVHGYIKGPDEKPLRVHDKTIYRLSR